MARRPAPRARSPARRTSSGTSRTTSARTRTCSAKRWRSTSRGRALPELRRSARRREALGRRVLLDEDRPADRARRRTLRALDALPPLHARLLSARARSSRASTGDPAAADFERAVARLASRGSPARRRPRPPAAHRRRRWRDAVADHGTAAGRPAGQPRGRGRAAASGPICQIGAAPEEAFWLLAHPRRSRSVDAPLASKPAAHARSGALADTGYYVSRTARGDHLVIDGGAARLPERRPRARRRAVADADGRAACRCSSIRAPAATPSTRRCAIGSARSHMHNTLVVDGRSQSVANGPFHWRTIAEQPRPAVADARGVRLLRRHARRLRADRHTAGASSRCTAICWSSPISSTDRARTPPPSTGTSIRAGRCTRAGTAVTFTARRRARVSSSCPDGDRRTLHRRRDTGPRLALAGVRPRRADDHAARHTSRTRCRSGS